MSSAAAAFGSAGIPACVHFLTMRTARNGCATGAAYRRSLLFCAPGAMNNQISPVDTPPASQPPGKWLNRTVLGTGLTSLASDWSHEMATTVLPGLLVTLGAGPGWLGAIEGAADGLSSFTKLAAGHWTDRLHRRKPLVVSAYALTAGATGAIAFATGAVHLMAARCAAWLGRGLRTPGRKALLAAAVPPSAYGRAFGFERMMDTLGAIVAPVT